MNKNSKKILEQRELRLKQKQEGQEDSQEILQQTTKKTVNQSRPQTTKASSLKGTWGQAKKPTEVKVAAYDHQ